MTSTVQITWDTEENLEEAKGKLVIDLRWLGVLMLALPHGY